MDRFCTCMATIDEQMYLVKEDARFFDFLDLDIYAPIVDCIKPEDVHKLFECIKEINEEGLEKEVIVLRMQGKDKEYRWMSIEVSPSTFDMNNRAMYNLRITDVEESINMFSELKNEKQLDDIFFTIFGNILFKYTSEDDKLQIYKISGVRKEYIYDGCLEDWQNSYMKDKVEDEVALREMCSGVRSGSISNYKLTTNAFTEDGTFIPCTFKFQNSKVQGNFGVVGVIFLHNYNSTNNPLVTEYEKDVGIDVLNKKSITTYAKKAIEHSKGEDIYLAIIDLDNFKIINDKFGHMFGDEVLMASGEIIKEAVGDKGIVGRIGGDELFVVLDRVEEYEELRNIMRNIRTNVEWYYKDKNPDVNLTCSIGVAAYPMAGDNYDAVFEIADKMLYRAKKKGRNRYIIYTPEIHGPLKTNDQGDLILLNEKGTDGQITVLKRLLEDYLTRRTMTDEKALNLIGNAFGLDEIVVCGIEQKICTTWDSDGAHSIMDDFDILMIDSEFLNDFNENNMFVMNGSYNIKRDDSEFAKIMKERRIASAVFYKSMRGDKYRGYIMFAKENVRQQWSEYELISLATVAKIMELVMMG